MVAWPSSFVRSGYQLFVYYSCIIMIDDAKCSSPANSVNYYSIVQCSTVQKPSRTSSSTFSPVLYLANQRTQKKHQVKKNEPKNVGYDVSFIIT